MIGTLDVSMYDVDFGVNRSKVKVTTEVIFSVYNRCPVPEPVICLSNHAAAA